MGNYKKYFTLSYDDGLEQDKALLALMRKYGIKGTFNLNSGRFGGTYSIKYIGAMGFQVVEGAPPKGGSIFKFAPANVIPEDEIRQVYEGMELASHGTHHLSPGKLDDNAFDEETGQDRLRIQKHTDGRVVGYAPPGNAYREKQKERLIQNGFEYARVLTSNRAKGESRFSFPKDPFRFSPNVWHISKTLDAQLDEFLRLEPLQGDMLYFFWGHAYDFDFDAMKKRRIMYTLEKMFDKVACDDSIIKCTTGEAVQRLLLQQKK